MVSVAIRCHFLVHFWVSILAIPSEVHFPQPGLAWTAPGHASRPIWLFSVSCKPSWKRCPTPRFLLTPLPGLTAPHQNLWPVSSRSVEAGTGSRHQHTPRSRHIPGTQQINVEEMKFQKWSENNACLAQTSQNALGRQRNTYPLSNLPTGALATLKFSPGASYGPEAKTPHSQCRRPRLIP